MSRAKILSLAKYVLACTAGILWLAASGFSQSITVSPLSNPPNTTIFVSGSGFSAGADVDIYFDTTDLALAVTDDTGSFSQIALHVPASAENPLPETNIVVLGGLLRDDTVMDWLKPEAASHRMPAEQARTYLTTERILAHDIQTLLRGLAPLSRSLRY